MYYFCGIVHVWKHPHYENEKVNIVLQIFSNILNMHTKKTQGSLWIVHIWAWYFNHSKYTWYEMISDIISVISYNLFMHYLVLDLSSLIWGTIWNALCETFAKKSVYAPFLRFSDLRQYYTDYFFLRLND